MKEFFSSVRFKILLGVTVVIGAFMLRAAWTGGFGTVTSSLLGAVTTPFQKLSAGVSGSVTDFFSTFVDAKAIKVENEKQKQTIRELNQKLVDYDKIKHQNEVYEGFLEIKERNPELEFEPAAVVGRDASDRFYSFTIDKGTLDGINVRDSVITADGLVGIISEVGLTYAKVSTILDPATNIGVYDSRTRDTALVTGTVQLAEKGLCKMYLLPRESGAAVGDLVVTSGISGQYPKEQVVGKIVKVAPESHGSSLYAVLEPTANIKSIKDVLVITSFAGQGEASSNPIGGTVPDQAESAESSGAESSSSSAQSEAEAGGGAP